MKTNKKIITLLTAAILVATTLASCGSENTTQTRTESTTSTQTTSGSNFDEERDITVVSREDGSGTRGAFVELFGIEEKDAQGNKTDRTTVEAVIANKTDVMLTNVAGDDYAIGYVSLGSLSDSVKAVDIDGAVASSENVKNGTYKAARPFNIATREDVSEVAKDFISFILSQEGQQVVTDGYIPVDENAAAYSGTKPAGKIVVAGSSSVTPIMEKLKEKYIEINPDATVEIQMSDSTSGMTSTIEGLCDIGMASRELKDSELEKLTPTVIALDGIAVIVNPDNPIENMTSENVKEVFTGDAFTWSEVE